MATPIQSPKRVDEECDPDNVFRGNQSLRPHAPAGG